MGVCFYAEDSTKIHGAKVFLGGQLTLFWPLHMNATTMVKMDILIKSMALRLDSSQQ